MGFEGKWTGFNSSPGFLEAAGMGICVSSFLPCRMGENSCLSYWLIDFFKSAPRPAWGLSSDPKIQSGVAYRLSQPGVPGIMPLLKELL